LEVSTAILYLFYCLNQYVFWLFEVLGAGEGAGSASLEVVASCLSCDIQRLAYEIESGGLFAFHSWENFFHMDSADHYFCFFSGSESFYRKFCYLFSMKMIRDFFDGRSWVENNCYREIGKSDGLLHFTRNDI